MNSPEINRANAQHSTGPTSEAGKQRSSMNALRHGLTAQAVVMPSEDLQAYQLHLKSFVDQFQPDGAAEAQLVQSLADASWRLNRIVALESNIMFLATPRQIQEDPAVGAALQTQAKTLPALSLHSQRLSRQYERTLVLLRDLQKTRRDQEQRDLDRLLNVMAMYKSKGETYDPFRAGFVFSKPQIDAGIRARNREILTRSAASHYNESA